MTRTLDQIERAMSKLLGEPCATTSATASSNGNAGGTTVVTTNQELLTRPGQYWVPYLLHIDSVPSGSNDEEVRQISDFSVSSGVATFTVASAFTAQVLANSTFRLHRWPLTWMYESISDALRQIDDILPRIIVEDFLTGELLRNNNLEQWSNNVPYDWEVVSGTVTRETTTKYQGASSLKIIGTSSSVRQRIPLEREMNGYTLAVSGYVNGKIANAPKLRITVGSTNTDSDTVAADDTWEQLSKTVSISDWTKPVYISLINNHVSQAAYFDALHLTLRDSAGNDLTQTHYIPISSAFRSIRQAWLRRSTTTTFSQYPFDTGTRLGMQNVFDGYARFDGWLTAKYPLRIIGVGVWPELTAAADTVDIEIHETELVANRGAQELLKKSIYHDHLGSTAHWKEMLDRLKADEKDLRPKQSPTKYFALPVTR